MRVLLLMLLAGGALACQNRLEVLVQEAQGLAGGEARPSAQTERPDRLQFEGLQNTDA